MIKENNKMLMSLKWKNNEMTFVVDKIEIPIYEQTTPFDVDMSGNLVLPNVRVKRYDKLTDTARYLDEDYINENYPYQLNNSGVKFHVKVDDNINTWFDSCLKDLSNAAPNRKDIVANGKLTSKNSTKAIDGAYIDCIEDDYCIIIADY